MFSMGESQRLQVTADAPLVSVSIDLASADGLPALPDTEVWEWSGAAQIPCNSAAPPREGKLTLSASGLEFVCAAMPHQPIHIATDALRAVSAPKSGSHAPLVIAKARHDHPHARDDSGADIADLLGPDPVNRVVIAFMQGTETARLAFDVYEDDDETAANLGAAALHEAVRERCQANADKDQAKREAKIAALQPTRVALIACPKCQARLRVKQAGAVQCPGCGARARVRAEQFLRRSA
jgi:hypothetical protein